MYRTHQQKICLSWQKIITKQLHLFNEIYIYTKMKKWSEKSKNYSWQREYSDQLRPTQTTTTKRQPSRWSEMEMQVATKITEINYCLSLCSCSYSVKTLWCIAYPLNWRKWWFFTLPFFVFITYLLSFLFCFQQWTKQKKGNKTRNNTKVTTVATIKKQLLINTMMHGQKNILFRWLHTSTECCASITR